MPHDCTCASLQGMSLLSLNNPLLWTLLFNRHILSNTHLSLIDSMSSPQVGPASTSTCVHFQEQADVLYSSTAIPSFPKAARATQSNEETYLDDWCTTCQAVNHEGSASKVVEGIKG